MRQEATWELVPKRLLGEGSSLFKKWVLNCSSWGRWLCPRIINMLSFKLLQLMTTGMKTGLLRMTTIQGERWMVAAVTLLMMMRWLRLLLWW